MGRSSTRSAILAVASCLVASFALAGPAFSAAVVPTAVATNVDRLVAYSQSGYVQGHLTANAPYTVVVKHGGVTKASATGQTDSNGAYLADVHYDNGTGEGLHNGDVVTVTDASAAQTYTQTMQLVATLDENTGFFRGIARPNAAVAATLYAAFNKTDAIANSVAVADSNGLFSIDWASLVTPAPTTDRPLWRAYMVNFESRDVPLQSIYRTIQTAAPTIGWTQNQGGGGYFWPGDHVTHELVNAGVVRNTQNTTVDADGIPRSNFTTDVKAGDVFRTIYHDAAGHSQTLDLNPFNFTATIDLPTRTVTGTTEPGAPVSSLLRNASGPILLKTRAAADGTWSLTFPVMESGVLESVLRIADPGFTGIGVQEILMHTPNLRIDDITGDIRGWGAVGVGSFTATVRRGTTTVGGASGTTTRGGGFSSRLSTEVLPGDTVAATSSGHGLPTYSLGTPRVTGHMIGTHFEGTAPTGRSVRADTGFCSATAVAANNAWTAPVTCPVAPTDAVLVTATQVSGATAGFLHGHFAWATSPEVTLTAPAALATVPVGATTLTASSFDYDDNAPPSAVWFYVDGKLKSIDTVAPFAATVTLVAGAHKVWAVAIDSGSRLAADGTPIYGTTAARTITAA